MIAPVIPSTVMNAPAPIARIKCSFRRVWRMATLCANWTLDTTLWHDISCGDMASPPLTPALFHVLLSLADGQKHGYAILKEVSERTGGSVALSTGTLYGIIKR